MKRTSFPTYHPLFDEISDMKLFVLSIPWGILPILLLWQPVAHCQERPTYNEQLPTNNELHAALDRHHDRLTAATLAEFDDAPANTWMNWTPAIGIGYAPNGEPRPTASFSLALADYYAAKLSPMEFLPKKKAMLTEQLALEKKEMELVSILTEITLFAGIGK